MMLLIKLELTKLLEEGVALVKKYDQEFPEKYFSDILNYLDITSEQFWKVIDKNRPSHLWEKTNNSWKLKHQVTQYYTFNSSIDFFKISNPLPLFSG